MKLALDHLLAYLTEEVSPNLTRLNDRLATIGTAWGVTIPEPGRIGIGFSREDQFPSVAILPARVDFSQDSIGGNPALYRTHQVNIGVACGDADDAVVMLMILAYNKAVQGLVVEDDTLGGRVANASLITSDFSDVASDDKFYRTIDISLAIRLLPSESEIT